MTTINAPLTTGLSTITAANAGQFNLKPADVAAMFSVNPKTVARWSSSGLLQSIRTPGGHRRYRETDVVALLNNRDDLPA